MSDSDIDFEFVKRIAEGANQVIIKPSDRPIIMLAALYTEVNLQFLKDEVLRIFETPVPKEDEEFFLENSFHITRRNAYSLDDYNRNIVLMDLTDRLIKDL